MSRLRGLAVVLAVVFAVAAGQLNGAGAWGQSPGEFAADSDRLLRVSGWAFAIWAPLYLGMVLFAARQTFRRSEGVLADLLLWPAALAFALTGVWIVAAAWDAEALTVVVIVSAALALVLPLWVGAERVRAAEGWDRRLTVWPVAALAGWLTVASPVNLVTVLAGNGELPRPEIACAYLAVALASAAALAVSARLRTAAYALPIAWGLTGVAAAEWSRNPPLAWVAGAAALIALGGALALTQGGLLSVAKRNVQPAA